MRIKLSSEQIKELAEFADGEDCQLGIDGKYRLGNEVLSAVRVWRSDGESVRIFENGMSENGSVKHA